MSFAFRLWAQFCPGESIRLRCKKKNTYVGVNNSLLLSRYFHTCLAQWGLFCFSCFFGQEPACSRHSSDLKKTLTRDLMEFSAPLKRTEKKKKASTWATLHLNTLSPACAAFFCTTCTSAIVSHYGSLLQLLSTIYHALLCHCHLESREVFFLFSLFLLTSLLANHGMKFCCLAMWRLGKATAISRRSRKLTVKCCSNSIGSRHCSCPLRLAYLIQSCNHDAERISSQFRQQRSICFIRKCQTFLRLVQ